MQSSSANSQNLLYFLNRSADFLQRNNIPNSKRDAQLLLSHVLKMDRMKLFTNFEMPLSPSEQAKYKELIMARAKSVPVAYLTGKRGFYKSEFKVTNDTLIPRPETEELVELILQENKEREHLRVLDLGTGTGAIGISLQLERSDWILSYSDVSKSALDVAKENYNSLIQPTISDTISEIQIQWYLSNLFMEIPDSIQMDIIVSNPPYIPLEEEDLLNADARHEPRLALFVDDFEAFHKRLLAGSFQRLTLGGALYLETHPDFAKSICDWGKEFGFSNCQIYNDLSNKQRFVRLLR